MSLSTIANTHTATHRRKTRTLDAVGGVNSSGWATVTSNVKGTLQPINESKQEVLAKLSIISTHAFYSPTALSFQNGDTLVISSETYDIVGMRDEAGRGRVYNYYLRKLKG